MYGSLLYLLLAVTIETLAPRGGEPVAWTHGDAAWIAAFPILVAWALRSRMRRHMRAALHSEPHAQRLRPRFTQLVGQYQGLLLVPYALLLYGTNYLDLLVTPMEPHSEVVASVLGLLPFLVFWWLLWWESYALHGLLFGRTTSRLRYTVGHARMDLPALAPWLLLMGFSDGLRWIWPQAYQALLDRPVLQLLYTPVFLLLAGIFLPVLVRVMWGCTPLPEGPVAERLRALLAREKAGVSRILLWPLMGGQVLTAGIVGLAPGIRYLLLTPGLLATLSDEEIDGVVAHEAGHVRHHHLWFYLLFFAGQLVCVTTLFFSLSELAVRYARGALPGVFAGQGAEAIISGTLTVALAALLFVALRLVFGAVSRAFERQADGHSLQTLGDATPVISALERISRYSGDIRDLPSWHHGSIAERVDWLAAAAADPAVLADHRRHVRRLVAGLSLSLVVMATAAATLLLPSVSEPARLKASVAGVQVRLHRNANDAAAWRDLGDVYMDAKKLGPAGTAYEQAIAVDPRDAQALNNLAWLHATSEQSAFFDPEYALELAERAAAIAPTPGVLDTLAEARFRTGNLQGAVDAIEEAMAQNPQDMDYFERQRERFLTQTPL